MYGAFCTVGYGGFLTGTVGGGTVLFVARGQLPVSLGASLLQVVTDLADADGRSLSRTVRLLVEEALEARESGAGLEAAPARDGAVPSTGGPGAASSPEVARWTEMLNRLPLEALASASALVVNTEAVEAFDERGDSLARLDTGGGGDHGTDVPPSVSSPAGVPAVALSVGPENPAPPVGLAERAKMLSGAPHGSQPPQGILGELLASGKVFKGPDPKGKR